VYKRQEYRIPFWRRFGVNFFFSAGTVAKDFSSFKLADVKPAFGTGARFMLDEKEKLNGRLDFAVGKGASGFYITIEEAF
jgi:hypothetical protein